MRGESERNARCEEVIDLGEEERTWERNEGGRGMRRGRGKERGSGRVEEEERERRRKEWMYV